MIRKQFEKNIVLIGMMGSGKSAAGRLAAEDAMLKFVDTDELVTDRIGMPIAKYFDKYGETLFRAAESDAISELAGTQGYIISTGGGVVLSEINMSYLKVGSIIVYLEASAETLLKRLKDDNTRPLLLGDEKEKTLSNILATRDPLYRKYADMIINTDSFDIEQVATMISALLK